MPAALPAVAGAAVAGGVAGALPSGVIASIAAGLAGSVASYGTYKAIGLDQTDPNADNIYSGVRINPHRANEPIPVVYGRALISGPLIYRRTYGNKNQDAKILIAWSEGPIDAVEDLYFDDRKLSEFSDEDARRVEDHLFMSGELNQQAHPEIVEEIEGWTTAHRLRGIAYSFLELVYNRNTWATGYPKIAALVRGRTLYDPRTKQTDWSRNGALALLDYLTNTIYGMSVPYSQINESAFIAAANYCDEQILYPSKNSHTRYRTDIVIDTSQDWRQNILAICTSFRGLPIYSGGVWSIAAEGSTTYHERTLSESMMLGDWEITLGDKKDRANRLRVEFLHAGIDYKPYEIVVKSSDMLEEDGGLVNEQTLALPGTTRKRIARYIASQELKQRRQSLTISGTCTLESLEYSVGDVVKVSNATAGWSEKPFLMWRMEIQAGDQIFVTLREYDPSVYTVSVNDSEDIPDTTFPDPFSRPLPRNVSITSGTNVLLIAGDGTVHSRMYVTWEYTKQGTVIRTELRWRESGASAWVYTQTDDDLVYLQPVVDTVLYEIELRSINILGASSPWTGTYYHQVIGQTAKPTKPAYISVSVAADDRRIFMWDDEQRVKDWAGWVISYGVTKDIDAMSTLHEGLLTDAPYLSDMPPAGSWYFAIQQVDRTGNYSDPRYSALINLTGSPLSALWEEEARSLGWPGTISANGYIDGRGALVATDSTTWTQLGPTWADSTIWASNPSASFTYTHTQVDLGASDTFITSAFVSGSDNLTAEIRHSADAASWSGWTAVGSQHTNRYIEFRVTVATTSDPIATLESARFRLLEV